MSYFEVKIKYEKQIESGKIVKVSEIYLFDAVSFTEAEAQATKELQPFISGNFSIVSIKRAKISELFQDEKGDKWYKCKVMFIHCYEKGKEKKVPVFMLVQAINIETARETLVECMKGTLSDYVIDTISETKIIDVYLYTPEIKAES